jgi:hypothetical protein
MTQNVTVTLSDQAYRRIKRWAKAREMDLGDALSDFLVENLPESDMLVVPPAISDPQVEQEKMAYQQLHPQLRTRYAGQYVAIHQGQLVDYDVDYGALFERIDDAYPDTFVWLTRVEEEAIGTISFRSPRFAEDEA